MLKEMEYLGFSVRMPDGVNVYVFDVDRDFVRWYGPYAIDGPTEQRTTMEDSAVITLSFTDGTMPISLVEFDARVHAGETWVNGEYNIFPHTKYIGLASMYSKVLKKKVPLHSVLAQEGDEFFISMFEQCIECVVRHDRADRKEENASPARKAFEANLGDMEDLFIDVDAYKNYKELIIDLLDEAYNVADPSLVKFILEQNEKLQRKDVPMEKRHARISRATMKKCQDDFVASFSPKRNKKAKKSV